MGTAELVYRACVGVCAVWAVLILTITVLIVPFSDIEWPRFLSLAAGPLALCYAFRAIWLVARWVADRMAWRKA